MKKEFNGFTLAETIIVIVVLGIIATLTIPALVNKNKESVTKTKVRKAMAAYESALNKMIIENDLKSDTALNEWASATANCGNPSNYFKKVQGDGCIFKTSDGIWWNISDIERPVISFKEINNGNKDTITANANNANDKTAFVLVGRFDNNGSLRVDDLAYETNHDFERSKAQVEKLYNLLGMRTSSINDNCNAGDAICAYKKYRSTPCNNPNSILGGWEVPDDMLCTNCSKCYTYNDGDLYIYDENGNIALYSDGCPNDLDYNGNISECSYYMSFIWSDTPNNGKIAIRKECNPEENSCGWIQVDEFNSLGQLISVKSDCDENGDNCERSDKYEYIDDNIIYYYGCDATGNNCEDSGYY